jgi:transcriptional regulator with XRE-family HTH domain
MDTAINTIGKNIRTLRQKHGWSQGQVANRLDISIPAFSKIETGITDINISRLNQISTLFQVNVYDIICGPSDHPIRASLDELNQCKVELTDAQQEIIRLQKRLIRVFDETHYLFQPVKTNIEYT